MTRPVTTTRYLLWIDGVGAWQICAGHEFIIGAPSLESASPDIELLANVSRLHATLHCDQDVWRLTAHQQTSISGKSVEGQQMLRSGDLICLSQRVELGFRIPTRLASSAVIDFESDHRPSHSLDGIILLTDHCLLGPRRDHHVFCAHWPDQVVLFQQEGQLKCRSSASLRVDGLELNGAAPLEHGSVVTGDDISFRIEQIH